MFLGKVTSEQETKTNTCSSNPNSRETVVVLLVEKISNTR